MISIEPESVSFPFNTISTEGSSPQISFTKTIKLRNTSVEKIRFAVYIFEEFDFSIIQKKTGPLFPGEYEVLQVQFSPKSWSVKEGTFYVKSSNIDQMIPITINAYPVIQNLKIPRLIDFGRVTVYEPQSRIISIFNDIPVDFEFNILTKKELPPNYFRITPMKGTLPKLQTITIEITFLPLTLCQANLEFTLNVSQYLFTPIQCSVFGIGEFRLPQKDKTKLKRLPNAIEAPKNQLTKREELANSTHHVERKSPAITNKKTESIFEKELNYNMTCIKRSELCPFVWTGQVLDNNSIENNDLMLETNESTGEITRIEIPPVVIEDYVSQPLDKTSNRLMLIFCKAIYKVIIRNRSKKRIPRLLTIVLRAKAKKSTRYGLYTRNGGRPETSDEYVEKLMSNAEIFKCKPPNVPYTSQITYDIRIPELPDLNRLRPVEIKVPTYAEKMGYQPLKHVSADHLYEVLLPTIELNSKFRSLLIQRGEKETTKD
ncbi:hypothetical protein BC833DRAFT_593193 [Globomyces pollinis-pini]|nr:hypothetical protein BC833DRAFT_593193 [Globomyces pollinis-pini]